MIERVTYTTQPSAQSMGRYITVYAPDGSYVSRHINMEECTESALAHVQANEISGTYRFVPPEKHMSVQIIKTVSGISTRGIIAEPFTGVANAVGPNALVTYPGNGPYDLTGIPARFEVVEFATAPTTTNSASVSNQTELNAALVTGNAITVNAGSYTSISITSGQTDIDLILSNSAVFSGGITISNGQRIRISGGVFQGASGGYAAYILDLGSHITFDNVSFTSAGIQVYTWNGNTPHHLSFLNSTIASSASGYGILTGPSPHLIVANMDISNTDAAVAGMRLASPSNVIIIDSRVYSSGNRIFRWNGDDADADLLLIQDSQLEGATGSQNMWLTPGSSTVYGLSRFEMHGTTYYNPGSGLGGGPFQIDGDQQGGVDDVIITNNTFYSPDSAVGGSSVTNFTSSPNTFNAYQSAPTFTGGADH